MTTQTIQQTTAPDAATNTETPTGGREPVSQYLQFAIDDARKARTAFVAKISEAFAKDHSIANAIEWSQDVIKADAALRYLTPLEARLYDATPADRILIVQEVIDELTNRLVERYVGRCCSTSLLRNAASDLEAEAFTLLVRMTLPTVRSELQRAHSKRRT